MGGNVVVALAVGLGAVACQGEAFSVGQPDGGPSEKKDAPFPVGDVDAKGAADAPSAVDASSRDSADSAGERDGAPPDASRGDTSPRDTSPSDTSSDASGIDVSLADARAEVADGGVPLLDALFRDVMAEGSESTYRGVVLADAPIAYWRMGIGNGPIVPDESGHQNDLLLQGGGHGLGARGAIIGDSDTAIRFDGVNSYALAAHPRAFDFPARAPFTIECWARRDPLPDGGEGAYFQHLIGGAAGGPPNRNGFLLYMLPVSASAPYLAFEYDVPDGDQLGLQGPLGALYAYAHYAVAFDGARAWVYVDGVLATSADVVGSISGRSSELAIGREDSTGRYNFSGAIDEVAVYDKALTREQIERHHTVALGARDR